MDRKPVRCEIDSRVALVTLDNPPLNALDRATRQGLSEVFEQLCAEQSEVRAVVIQGAGARAFSSGADLKVLQELDPASARQYLGWSQHIYNQVDGYPWPVIAAIEGYCLGGGLELALCCDLRYADQASRLGFPEINLSTFPGNGGIKRALDILTLGTLKELVYSGRMIDASEAYDFGLVERVLPPGQAVAAAMEMARELASKPPLGLMAAKKVLNRTRDLSLPEYLELECEQWAALTGSHDMKEGIAAFLAKRNPNFKGR